MALRLKRKVATELPTTYFPTILLLLIANDDGARGIESASREIHQIKFIIGKCNSEHQ